MGFLQCLEENDVLRPAWEDGAFRVFDDVQLRSFPAWLPSVPSPSVSPWKMSNRVFSRARMKAPAQSSCSIFKSSPVQHLASVACVSYYSPLLCCGIQAPSWRPWREQMRAPCKCGSRAREPLHSPGVTTRSSGLGWTRYCLKKPISFPNFHRFWVGLHPLVRLTGL